jgi:outer membrane protein
MRRIAPILLAAAACMLALSATAQVPGPTLTLDDAIRLALSKNKLLRVASFSPKISRANLLVARGAFDPSLQFSRTYSQSDFTQEFGPVPVEDVSKTDYYSAAVAGLLPIGTQYRVGANTQEFRDALDGSAKSYDTFGGVSVTQPLLQGFGLGFNLVNVRIAKANRAISDMTYKAAAINTVTSVIVAYSNLQLAHDQLGAAESSRALASSLLAENEKEYKIGSISQSDVIQARASRAVFYEEPVIIAERAVRDAQDALRELIGEEAFFEDEPLFTLAPVAVPDVTVDRHADLLVAYQKRPDYIEARLAITKNRASEAYARNALLPQVDFTGSYGYEGVSSSFYTSRQQVENHQNPSTSAGLSVTIPLTYAIGRGNLRAARLTREQAEEQLRSMEADIAVQVAGAIGQIETTRRRVATDQKSYALAKQALDAEEKKKKAGQSSTLYVVQEQQLVAEAENNISFALAAERQAVANYDQALGTTLERYHVTLTDD